MAGVRGRAGERAEFSTPQRQKPGRAWHARCSVGHAARRSLRAVGSVRLPSRSRKPPSGVLCTDEAFDGRRGRTRQEATAYSSIPSIAVGATSSEALVRERAMAGRFSSVIARGVVLGLLLPAAAGVSAPSAIAERSRPAPPRVDVLFEPTPHAVVDAMLRLAKVGPEDFLIDLGSGMAAPDRCGKGLRSPDQSRSAPRRRQLAPPAWRRDAQRGHARRGLGRQTPGVTELPASTSGLCNHDASRALGSG